MARNYKFPLLIALVSLTFAPAALAQDSDMDYALQDAREWANAMNFVQSMGLDTSKGIEYRSGLWNLVIVEGEGPRPKASHTVTLHATGWLADGTRFWSSHDGEGEPIANEVKGFVKGFTEGLRRMKVGGKSMLVFPGRLGYGPGGNPGAGIHPNATLIFEVELLSME